MQVVDYITYQGGNRHRKYIIVNDQKVNLHLTLECHSQHTTPALSLLQRPLSTLTVLLLTVQLCKEKDVYKDRDTFYIAMM